MEIKILLDGVLLEVVVNNSDPDRQKRPARTLNCPLPRPFPRLYRRATLGKRPLSAVSFPGRSIQASMVLEVFQVKLLPTSIQI